MVNYVTGSRISSPTCHFRFSGLWCLSPDSPKFLVLIPNSILCGWVSKLSYQTACSRITCFRSTNYMTCWTFSWPSKWLTVLFPPHKWYAFFLFLNSSFPVYMWPTLLNLFRTVSVSCEEISFQFETHNTYPAVTKIFHFWPIYCYYDHNTYYCQHYHCCLKFAFLLCYLKSAKFI